MVLAENEGSSIILHVKSEDIETYSMRIAVVPRKKGMPQFYGDNHQAFD
jgi:hypothetical protein